MQPKILSQIHCVKKKRNKIKNTLGSRGNTEIIRTLFFCFEWTQIGEDIALLIAAQERALITISIFVLNHCVEFITVFFLYVIAYGH